MKHRIMYWMISLCLFSLQPAVAQSNKLSSTDSNPRDLRQIVLISDLHIGIGRETQRGDAAKKNDWDPMEDFRWDHEFRLFLNKIQESGDEAGVPTDLIIVGDLLELWQWAGDTCGHHGKGNLGCSEDQALSLVNHIVASHQKTFQSLSNFVNKGNNRIIILPGNHDAALVFKKVAEAMENAIPAKPGKVRVVREGYWLSSDGRIFVEHGHQIEGDSNMFRDKNLPAFCTDMNENPVDCNVAGTIAYLQRTFGENFVQKFFNRCESKFPIIDNLSEESLGIRYGLEASNISEISSIILHGFKFFLLQQTFSQAMQGLGEETNEDVMPEWDYATIRKKETQFLVESIPPDTALRHQAEKLLSIGKLKLAPADLTDEELDQICSIRAGLIEEGKLNVAPCPEVGPPAGLGAFATSLISNRNKILARHLSQRKAWLSNIKGRPQRFEYFIFGHTHKAEPPFTPFEPGERWRPQIINTGAWQRIATAAQLKAIQKAKKIQNKEALLALGPEDLYPCYTYVRITPDDSGNPEPFLEYWIKDPNTGKWKISISCPYPECTDE